MSTRQGWTEREEPGGDLARWGVSSSASRSCGNGLPERWHPRGPLAALRDVRPSYADDVNRFSPVLEGSLAAVTSPSPVVEDTPRRRAEDLRLPHEVTRRRREVLCVPNEVTRRRGEVRDDVEKSCDDVEESRDDVEKSSPRPRGILSVTIPAAVFTVGSSRRRAATSPRRP